MALYVKPNSYLYIHVVFSDFGFAHYVIGETEADILRGSPLYMAPEIVTKSLYDEKADLWSVGVILYGQFILTFQKMYILT